MVGVNNVNPLSLPPTTEVKKLEIQKVVEGFDMEQNGGLEDSSTNIEVDGGGEDVYGNSYNNLRHDPILENLTDLSSETHNKKNKIIHY